MVDGRSQELVLRQSQTLALEGASLDDLVRTVRSEHELVLESATSALLHARFAGEALMAARELVSRGTWLEWLLTTFDFKLSTAYNYMRVARHWEAVVEAGYAGLTDAVKGIARKGIAGQKARPGVHKYGPDVYAAIRDLHSSSGWSMRRISIEMGVSEGVVARAVNPEKVRQADRRRNMVERQRRKALKEQRRRDLARKAGGDIGAAYSGTLKLAEILTAAIGDEADFGAKAALNSALLHLYGVEDLVVKALGTHKAFE